MSGATASWPRARSSPTSGSQHAPSCQSPWRRQNVTMDRMSSSRPAVAAAGRTAELRVRGSARGKASGINLERTLGHLFTLRTGKVVRIDIYGTWEEALEAVGLRE